MKLLLFNLNPNEFGLDKTIYTELSQPLVKYQELLNTEHTSVSEWPESEIEEFVWEVYEIQEQQLIEIGELRLDKEGVIYFAPTKE